MITVQQQAARMTRQAWEGLLHTAAFVPADKREWAPQGKARTFYDYMAECVVMADWGRQLIETGEFGAFDPEAYTRAKAELDTLDKIQAAGGPAIERLCTAIEAFPAARLEETKQMPWGFEQTYADILFNTYWNMVYHWGQVNYVQMMLGDTDMH